MKYILFFFIISTLSFYSCGDAKIKSVNGVFADDFKYKWNSPWIDKSEKNLDFIPDGKGGFKIMNVSRRYYTGMHYHDFPIKLMEDFELDLEFLMRGQERFIFFLGYKDFEHREGFSFSKRNKRFSYTRFRGKQDPIRISKACKMYKRFNNLKIVKKNDEMFVYLNKKLLLNMKKVPSYNNSIGIGLGPKTSVQFRKIEITETNF